MKHKTTWFTESLLIRIHNNHKLDAAMRRAEDKMDPVLVVFLDQVLFLKHNLNAKAIASLQDELVAVEEDVALLVKDMEESIAETERFISTMTEE